ncbi:hypothetical protein ACFY0N_38365 [Streptomyces vinaceus]|uniref:hypothetical protein n=1 Tax=Streptomyces vinaceus TaxID=1960 RepID=UPI0035E2288A
MERIVFPARKTSYDYTRPYWDQFGATIGDRHVFDRAHERRTRRVCYLGSLHAPHLLQDPDTVIHGSEVLHLRYRVRR